MWKCVFNATTKRGVAIDRDAGVGEYAIMLQKEDCMNFRLTPTRYMGDGSSLVEYPGWEAEQQAEIEANEQAAADLAARIASIEAALDVSELKGVTVDQAETWIDNQLNLNALQSQLDDLDSLLPAYDTASLSELKEPLRDILIGLRNFCYQLAVRANTCGNIDKKQLPGILPNT